MKYISIFLLISLWSNHALALNCDAIMKHGMTNIRIKKSNTGSIVNKYFNHCHKDFNSLDDKTLASVNVEVFEYGSGDGSFERHKVTESLTQWCKSNKDFAQQHQSIYEETRSIYGQAVDAWNECNKLDQQGVQVDISITPNNKAIDIGLRYLGAGQPNVEYLGITEDGFSCQERTPSGQKASREAPVMITPSAINISCKREPAKTVTRGSGDYEVLDWGRVTIHTASAPFQFYFEQEETPTLPTKAAIQLKTELEALQKKHNGLQKGLDNAVIAFNTNSCPHDWTEYTEARGRFLRGIDSQETTDPDGKRDPGSPQEDMYAKHSHGIKVNYHQASGGADFSMAHNSPTTKKEEGHIAAKGGSETRPKNVAVLFCQPPKL